MPEEESKSTPNPLEGRQPRRREVGVLTFEGVRYRRVFLGGFGISIGLRSIVVALDGENEGKLYEVNIQKGIHEIIREVSQEYLDERRKHQYR